MIESYADEKSRKMALLIDGDNAQPSRIGDILAEVGKYGLITIRRIYGDWTTVNMAGWKKTLHENAIQPVQQFRYTIGKNATDSALIIDAMDILHSQLVEGFCVVSSDSDYTRLATRIREAGFFVMGIGKRSTPKAFINACNVFIYTENLGPREREKENKRRSRAEQSAEQTTPRGYDPLPLLKAAVDMAIDEGGWAKLSTIGFYLRQLDPGFDPRTYGFRQLSQLVKAFPDVFELRFENEKGLTRIWVRIKE
ncbi:MAG: NYN domain-containing protein [Acidobacteriota bacterium]|nr:NYN domain-containing protein [Acidobacteriota bacterium]MDW3228469.1 NYN domain-containing protein [Acidobacteriota bacterium]MDY0232014.1 NYN domain-containing protein [Candidatus Saccharicenans sp.]